MLAFTDDDCLVDSGWIRTLCMAMGPSNKAAVGGRTVNGLGDNRWSAASQRIIDLVYAYYNANPAHATFLTTNNLAVPTEAFRDLGGFDEGYRTAEDRDLCRRWLRSGREMIYTPEALVYHEHALTFPEFWRQHFNYGRGAFRFRSSAAADQRLENLVGLYESMPRFVSASADDNRNGGSHRRAGLAADLALWQAANAAGFAWEAARSALITDKRKRKTNFAT